MGERDQVWEHEENLFLEFRCKYYVKEFHEGGAARLKEHLAGKSVNVSRCTKSKRLKGMLVRFDATIANENSSTYQESNDSSSKTPSDDGNDGDDTDGGTASLAAQGGGSEQPLSPFTID
jgi:hypothetical protein